MGICPTSSKVRVTIFFGDGTSKNIETPGNITVTVNNNPSTAKKSCYRWWAMGGSNAAHPSPYLCQIFGCCATAGWLGNSTLLNNPEWTGDATKQTYWSFSHPICDGVDIGSNSFMLPDRSKNLDKVSNFPIVTTSDWVTWGSCGSCVASQPGKCSVSITSAGGVILFQTQGACPITYEANCDDDCHDGCCKVITQSYPGYCCAKSP